ncbi:MAG: hypothetical protein JOZ32_08345 [Bryobacterales bacterium]|nr:hypothetical protein [Bryobacterales bacterium]
MPCWFRTKRWRTISDRRFDSRPGLSWQPAYLLVSISFFVGRPPLHFLWNVTSFFLAFYLVSAMREYASAVPVAVVIGTAVVYWDRTLPAGTNVADTYGFACQPWSAWF